MQIATFQTLGRNIECQFAESYNERYGLLFH